MYLNAKWLRDNETLKSICDRRVDCHITHISVFFFTGQLTSSSAMAERPRKASKLRYLKVLTQRNFVAEFQRENVSFYSRNSEFAFLSHPFLGGMGA